jgi:pimeloyl-ACP methyl ester carboxylesterase
MIVSVQTLTTPKYMSSLTNRLASWSDHPRDLFLMINHFRRQITQPIVGVGHSMGGCHLVRLSLMHPRLFTTIILMDPVIQRLPSRQGNYGPAKASTMRRDRWPSRKAAEASFKRSKFYQTWDPRVLDLWVKYGLRDLPTLLHPDTTPASNTLPPLNADPSSATVSPDRETETDVTLTTTKHQEVFTFMRPNFSTPTNPNPEERPNPVTHPDVDLEAGPNSPFYRPEPISTFHQLPYLRPSVLYIFGDQSFLSAPLLKADKMAHTGTGTGGSGGFKKGRVQEVTFEGIGHLIPMEVVGKTADACQDWLALELANWKSRATEHQLQWANTPREERGKMSEEFVAMMKSDWMGEPAKPKL